MSENQSEPILKLPRMVGKCLPFDYIRNVLMRPSIRTQHHTQLLLYYQMSIKLGLNIRKCKIKQYLLLFQAMKAMFLSFIG